MRRPRLCIAFLATQAFFLSLTSARGGVSAPSYTDAFWGSRHSRRKCYRNREGSDGNRKRLDERAVAQHGSLRMNHLEEVPEDVADKVLFLECPDTGKRLECYAERFAVIDGQRYLAAFPKDPAVAVAFDEDGEVAPVPLDDPLMSKLFPLAEACVTDLGLDIELLRTPAALTVRGLDNVVETFDDHGGSDVGGPLEAAETGEKESTLGSEEYEDEEDDFGDDADEVELLGEFLLEGEEFLLVRFLEPLLVMGKEAEPGRYVLLDAEEDQDVNPAVEELLSAGAL